jgi:hypothetical protein
MDCYITKDMAKEALANMRAFHSELDSLYSKYDFDLKENLGRRNILLSQAQEAFFAKALQSTYLSTTNDGRTGEPDIVIPELNRELECKLTSRQKSGSISFQSDYETLQKKGSLDYLYVIASEDFDEFTVVHYSGLTVHDFRPLSNGARGKVQLRKHAAANKATVVFGSIDDLRVEQINSIKQKMANTEDKSTKKYKKLLDRLSYWKDANARYRFNTEVIAHGS